MFYQIERAQSEDPATHLDNNIHFLMHPRLDTCSNKTHVQQEAPGERFSIPKHGDFSENVNQQGLTRGPSVEDATSGQDKAPRPPEEHLQNEDRAFDVVIEIPEIDKDEEDLGWPIALRKGVRSCRMGNKYPLTHYIFYNKLGAQYKFFVTSLSQIHIPTTMDEAIRTQEWQWAMDDEMKALVRNQTWELVKLPPGKGTVGCRWVYIVKYKADGTLDKYKAILVAKGYKSHGIYYSDTFTLVAKFNTVRILIALAAKLGWNLYQYDDQNAFLHGELEDEVYMNVSPGYILTDCKSMVCRLKKALYGLKQSPRMWFGKVFRVMHKMNYKQSNDNHTMFFCFNPTVKQMILIVYVDYIIITGDDAEGIKKLSQDLSRHLDIKDLGKLKYFLGIEVAYSQHGIVLSQHKYVLDLLKKTGKILSKPVVTPGDCYVRLDSGEKSAPVNEEAFQRLVGKLTYLNHT